MPPATCMAAMAAMTDMMMVMTSQDAGRGDGRAEDAQRDDAQTRGVADADAAEASPEEDGGEDEPLIESRSSGGRLRVRGIAGPGVPWRGCRPTAGGRVRRRASDPHSSTTSRTLLPVRAHSLPTRVAVRVTDDVVEVGDDADGAERVLRTPPVGGERAVRNGGEIDILHLPERSGLHQSVFPP